ncbi:MAG: tetratricopeptide repeat protein [Candidatus Thorarchaeota archaeon]
MSEVLKSLFEVGKYQEVVDQFTQNEVQGTWAALSEEEQITCIYYKCRSLNWLGRAEEALQIAVNARTIYPSPKNPSYLLALLAAQLYSFYELMHYQKEEAQSALLEGEAVMEALTDNECQIGAIWVAVFEHIMGLASWFKKELSKAIEFYHKAITSFKELDSIHSTAQCLYDLSMCYYYRNEMNTATKYLQQSLTLYESLGNKRGIGQCMQLFGHLKSAIDDLDMALDCYKRSLSFFKAGNTPLYIGNAMGHIGSIYSLKNEPEKALDFFRQSLAVVEPLGIDWVIAYAFFHIGETHHQKGALDIALPFYQSSLAKFEALGIDYDIVRLLFHLILLSLDQQEIEQAQNYLASLQKVASRVPDENVGVYIRKHLAEALVLKQSPRIVDKARAQNLLTQIMNDDKFQFSGYLLIALIALCDLLLFEFKASDASEVWEEVKTLMHQFYTEAQDHQEVNIVVNALLLRAKFATVEGELDQAMNYFNEAKRIVIEKKLSILMNIVEKEQKEFEANFHKWQDLIQQHVSLKELLVQAQLSEYIQRVQKIVQRSPLKKQ